MRINVWGINYWPELTGIAVYNKELCDYLVSRSWQVDMVTTFSYYPFWRKKDEDCRILYRSDQVASVKVHRCWHYVPSKPSAISRIVHEGTFVLTSSLRQLFLAKPDAYIVVSPPLLLGLAAWVVSRIKGAPFHFHVQDLQPDAALALNMLKGGVLVRSLYALEKLAYSKATSVSGISTQMCEAIRGKGVSQSKIVPFPNWVELLSSEDLPAQGSWKEARGIDRSTRIVSYSGNLGVKQGLGLMIETARSIKDEPSILFVISGDGADRSRLEQLKRNYNLDNVMLEGVLSERDHSALLVDSDICLIPQKPGSGAYFLPSKLLKILALQRPIITNAEATSALTHAVEEGQFGLTVADSTPETLAKAIVDLLSDEPARRRMGEAGLAYVKRFSKELVLPGFEEHLAGLIDSK